MGSLAATHVPGTVHLVDLDGTVAAQHSGDDKIVLIPPPSADLEDPLNWSKRRKLLSTFCCMLYTCWVAAGVGATPTILPQITEATGLTTAQLVEGVGYMFLTFGWGCLVFQPLAQQYGKRPIYLISIAGTAAVMVWHAYVRTNQEFIAIKLAQGFLGAPVESLSEVSMTDIYFQHERGQYIALYGLVLYVGIYVMTIIAGFINDGQGWQWVLFWCAIFNALSFVFLFFFMEETNYTRKTTSEAIEEVHTTTIRAQESHNPSKNITTTEAPASETSEYPRTSFRQKLALIRRSDLQKPNRLLSMIWRPLEFFTYPCILYSGIAYGCIVVWWTVLINTVSPILSVAPYHFSATSIGLTYFSVLIGTVIGWVAIGWYGDRFLLFMAVRNGGISEPEHRQWLNAVNLFLLPASLLLFGLGAAYELHWFTVVFAMGLMGLAIMIGLQLSIAYCLDSYKDFGADALVTVIIVRNMINFGVSYGITPWIENMGLRDAFVVAAVAGFVQVATFGLAVRYGKGFRRSSVPRYERHMKDLRRDGAVH
ncbi:major facilitator superfamily domain-containing protein [Aspergillus karnatakaensis]|uniref:major facilitator superfamily domain-containing protein n=1 Tax=Aspergillus karnatakaensis TaxID=1810916 RepID=UPI003CCD262B